MDVYQNRFDVKIGDEKHFGFFSDLHCDSKLFDEKRFKYDMEEALSYDSRIYIGGDLADLIMPTDTKRYSKERDDIARDAGLNEVTNRCYELLLPYVNSIDWIGFGNHEDSTLKYNNYDLTLGVITLLNQKRDPALRSIHHGGYKSYIRWKFSRNLNAHTTTLDILHFHGKGSSSPVTKGMIDINRLKTAYIADVYWIGHKHTGIGDIDEMTYLNQGAHIADKQVLAFYTAGYQGNFLEEDYSEGYKRNFEDRQLGGTTKGFVVLKVKILRESGYLMRIMR